MSLNVESNRDADGEARRVKPGELMLVEDTWAAATSPGSMMASWFLHIRSPTTGT